jgi:type VI secretion system protein VasJ
MIENLDNLIKPLSPHPCGEDPRYHDDFIFIKQEIEKLSGANFREVISKSKNILLTYSKDLRILAYLVLAMTAVEGINGFIESLKLCESLIKSFGESLHPQNPTLRQLSLHWLNQPRIINLLPQAISKENFYTIKNLLQEFNVNLPLIQKWLSEKTPIETSIIIEEPKITQNTISSLNNLEENTRLIIHYLRSEKLFLQAAYYARALRWGNLECPIHENNITFLEPPREANFIQLQQAIIKEEPEIIFELCENFFLETGGVFWLDLQYHAVIATSDDLELSRYLTQSIKALLEKFPELMDLHFKDNKPFAAEETRQWLLSLIEQKEKSKEKSSSHTRKIRAKDLNSHLKQLKIQQAMTVKEKFENHYQMAKACMQHKRYDIAFALFQLLEKNIEYHHLEEWEPELILNIWQDFYETLDIQSKKDQDNRKIELLNMMSLLQMRICQLDVLRGMRL